MAPIQVAGLSSSSPIASIYLALTCLLNSKHTGPAPACPPPWLSQAASFYMLQRLLQANTSPSYCTSPTSQHPTDTACPLHRHSLRPAEPSAEHFHATLQPISHSHSYSPPQWFPSLLRLQLCVCVCVCVCMHTCAFA
jgi:hypothetical protein